MYRTHTFKSNIRGNFCSCKGLCCQEVIIVFSTWEVRHQLYGTQYGGVGVTFNILQGVTRIETATNTFCS